MGMGRPRGGRNVSHSKEEKLRLVKRKGVLNRCERKQQELDHYVADIHAHYPSQGNRAIVTPYLIDMLAAIQTSLTELTTKEELISYMERQITILTEYAENSRELTEQFTAMMEQTVTASTERMNTATESMCSQVGKASENFSQSLSSEQETVRAFAKRSMLIGLIPTAVLIVWELIRHIFLLT